MTDPVIDLYGNSREAQALIRLNRWLSYEVRSGWGVLLLFWLPTGIVMSGLYLLIAVFLPLLLLELYRARWFGSMVWLVVLVAAGFFIPRSFAMDPRMLPWVWSAGLFIPFYFYCWVLRWVVAEKVDEIRELATLEQMRAVDRSVM